MFYHGFLIGHDHYHSNARYDREFTEINDPEGLKHKSCDTNPRTGANERLAISYVTVSSHLPYPYIEGIARCVRCRRQNVFSALKKSVSDMY
jgi:hypothetical protein